MENYGNFLVKHFFLNFLTKVYDYAKFFSCQVNFSNFLKTFLIIFLLFRSPLHNKNYVLSWAFSFDLEGEVRI